MHSRSIRVIERILEILLFDIRFRLEIKWVTGVSVNAFKYFQLFKYRSGCLLFTPISPLNAHELGINRGKKGSLRQKRGDGGGAFTIDKRAKVEQSRASSMAITDNESGQTL